MSLIAKIKSVLPITRRRAEFLYSQNVQAFDDLNRSVLAKLEETQSQIIARIEQADNGINGNIDFKYHQLLEPELKLIQNNLEAHDTHMKLLAWYGLRNNDESLTQTKIKFFRSIPKAQGKLRTLQKSCIELLAKFNKLCKENSLQYWACCGTLLGAIRHLGFIPWDDDIDLGMMRADIERLKKVLSANSELELTTVYDHYVHAEQLRLRFKNSDNPAFLDIFYFDFIASGKQSVYKAHQKLREQMVADMEADERLTTWTETPYLPERNKMAPIIKSYIEKYVQQEIDKGFIVKKEDAEGIIWSLDNLYPNDRYEWAVPIKVMFPLQSTKFEEADCLIPNDSDYLLTGEFGDYLELPADIKSHFKHVNLEDV